MKRLIIILLFIVGILLTAVTGCTWYYMTCFAKHGSSGVKDQKADLMFFRKNDDGNVIAFVTNETDQGNNQNVEAPIREFIVNMYQEDKVFKNTFKSASEYEF